MPDFSLLQTPNFGQAALGGWQAGKAISQQNEREGALKGYLSNPDDPVAGVRLAAADQQLGMPIMERQRALAERKRVGELAARAAAGDHAAAHELWTANPELAQHFDERDQKALKEGMSAIGDAALRISTLPDAQIPAAADQAIDALSQQFPNLAQFRGHIKTRADLNGVLDQTGMTEKALEMQRTHWQARPGQGGALIPTDYMGNRLDGADPHAASYEPSGGGDSPIAPGTTVNGKKFKGGDYRDPNNWEAGGAGSSGPQTFP